MGPLTFTENYFNASGFQRNKMRKEVFKFFVEEGEGSLFKAELLMWDALAHMEQIEAYEECAILKDILKSIGSE